MIILGSLESVKGTSYLVLIELFSLGITAEGATSNYCLKIGDFAPTGAGWTKI